MSAVVWKFPLRLTEGQSIELPAGAEVLTVGMQHEGLMLWARVDPYAPKETRLFAIVGTRHAAPGETEARYVGTAFDGPYVWHIFEQRPA